MKGQTKTTKADMKNSKDPSANYQEDASLLFSSHEEMGLYF